MFKAMFYYIRCTYNIHIQNNIIPNNKNFIKMIFTKRLVMQKVKRKLKEKIGKIN